MTPPEKHRRRRSSKRHEKSIVREFTVEIIIGVIFLFGVFLLFEDMEIKTFVFHGVMNFFQAITHWFSNFLVSILGLTQEFETSDIVGTLLIIFAFLLLSLRVRQKAILRFHDLDECPECGGDMQHVPRNLGQRVVSRLFFIKIRRYHCKACDFDGLRIRAKHSR